MMGSGIAAAPAAAPKPAEFLVWDQDQGGGFQAISLVRQDASGLLRLLDNAVDVNLFRAKRPRFQKALLQKHPPLVRKEARYLYDDSDGSPRLIYPSDRNKLEVYYQRTDGKGEAALQGGGGKGSVVEEACLTF